MIKLQRTRLAVVLNALYDSGTDRVTVSHSSDAVGDLLEIDLADPSASTVRVLHDVDAYRSARDAVQRDHGRDVVDELPDPRSYATAFLAGGLLDPPNRDEIAAFLERYGRPDLGAGHRPVVAGFDTNLLAWRIADVLGLQPGQESLVNGFALATGVRDELNWDDKRSDTRPLEDAFGPEFEQLWNQPAGARRQGRLGENYYRQLRDHRYADEIVSDTGDEAIVEAYDEYQTDGRKDVLLFSNDRNFIERARAHRVLAQRVDLPRELPAELTGSWTAIQNTLSVLTVLFGVLSLPKLTLYGVWKGKTGQAWHDERLAVDCRSPKLEPLIERDLSILQQGDRT